MSEYLAEHWQLRRWLSGFSGSAGTVVVTADRAMLWTDSRYFLQAAQELDGTGIELMKDGLLDSTVALRQSHRRLKGRHRRHAIQRQRGTHAPSRPGTVRH